MFAPRRDNADYLRRAIRRRAATPRAVDYAALPRRRRRRTPLSSRWRAPARAAAAPPRRQRMPPPLDCRHARFCFILLFIYLKKKFYYKYNKYL